MTKLLIDLRRMLDEAIDTMVSVCERRNEDFPHLDAPADPSEFSPEGIRNDPEVAQAIKLGVAAASHLVTALQSPIQAVANVGFMAIISANLAAAERVHIPEIIRKSGDQGMHISEIVQYNGTSVDKLERILRHLATHHIFREVSPGVFAHNKLSSLLDTGKDYEVIATEYVLTEQADNQSSDSRYTSSPDNKYNDTNGLCAFVAMMTDELSKAYPFTADLLEDLSFADSQEVNETTVQRALRMKHTIWQYYDLPENAARGRRFNIAMQGSSALQPPDLILRLYDWTSLPQRATVVDVGSGLGHASLGIAQARPDLTFILEDRPSVVAHAKEYWTQTAPSAVMANAHFLGAVTSHSKPLVVKFGHLAVTYVTFFARLRRDVTDLPYRRVQITSQPRPVTVEIVQYLCAQPQLPFVPDVFLVRHALHNQPDKYAAMLLSHLRNVATQSTKLLIVDFVVGYACTVPELSEYATPGDPSPTAPPPLLPNYGAAGVHPYNMDMAMLSYLNAKERTIKAWRALLSRSGWQLVTVKRDPVDRTGWPLIIAELADGA